MVVENASCDWQRYPGHQPHLLRITGWYHTSTAIFKGPLLPTSRLILGICDYLFLAEGIMHTLRREGTMYRARNLAELRELQQYKEMLAGMEPPLPRLPWYSIYFILVSYPLEYGGH